VYIKEVMPHKLQIELAYMEQRTLWTDLRVLLDTLSAMLR
jgi:lipopolysaccharide/colanic/teichoic acid biosynthesis glycosyltransferase